MNVRRTMTRESEDLRPSSPADEPRLIRFFRADDPFDVAEEVILSGQTAWKLGRLDEALSMQCTSGHIGSCDDSLMSSRHAALERDGTKWLLSDTASKNGTYVNGSRLETIHRLLDGDIIECGHSFFIYREGANPSRPPIGTSVASKWGAIKLPPSEYQIAPLLPYATSDLSVHLHGETGTGKEVVARAIHELSGRRGPFVARNCAAIPDSLFESEMFGYAKGAFSGASATKRGQILEAQGGTLFLDEIADLSLPMQAKLLRVLELKEVLPLGASVPIAVDFRLVSATHCNLGAMVDEGRFRGDLYGRLGPTFTVPALRANREKLGQLIRTFLAARLSERRQHGAAPSQVCFTLAAARALVRYAWPYNVRELKQAVESALIGALAECAVGSLCSIELSHLPPQVSAETRKPTPPPLLQASAPEPLFRVEPPGLTAERLNAALDAASGNRSEAARLLGVSERTVFRKLRRLREAASSPSDQEVGTRSLQR